MVKKVIDVRKKRSSSSGSYSNYYNLGKGIGLKVLSPSYHKDYLKEFYDEAIEGFKKRGWSSCDITAPAQEMAIMEMLSKSNKIPKVFGLCWVKTTVKDIYQIGILMEHIEGKMLEDVWSNELMEKFERFEIRSRS